MRVRRVTKLRDRFNSATDVAARLLLAALVTACCCGGEESQPAPLTAELSVENGTVHFYDDENGVYHTDAFVLSNTGTASLWVVEMSLDAPEDAFDVETPELPFILNPGQSRTIEVTFTPIDCWSDEGEMLIWTDLDEPTTVYFRPDDAASDVYIEPSDFDFGRLTVGESSTLTATIINPGGCVFTIEEMALSGTTDIRFSGVEDPETEIQPFPDAPISMVDEKQVEVDITYAPTDAALAFSVLYVLTDHPRQDLVRASIVGNAVEAE